jgi:hypothetical protein
MVQFCPLPPQERLRSLFLFDEDSGSLIWKVRPEGEFHSLRIQRCWNTTNAGKPAGTIFKKGVNFYIGIRIDGHRYTAHRLIMRWLGIEIEGLEIDHKDGDGTNNRLGNLRVASSSENHWNTRGKKRTSEKNFGLPKGVTKVGNRYMAQISKNGIRVHCGYHATIELAKAAWIEKATELHGEFRRD